MKRFSFLEFGEAMARLLKPTPQTGKEEVPEMKKVEKGQERNRGAGRPGREDRLGDPPGGQDYGELAASAYPEFQLTTRMRAGKRTARKPHHQRHCKREVQTCEKEHESPVRTQGKGETR